jgi:hypothetical protein
VQELSRGDVEAAAASAAQRLTLLKPLVPRPDLAFEYSDALHMASLTNIGAGHLATAQRYAQQRQALLFHREEGHLAVNWLLVVAALDGELDRASELGEQFQAGWERAGCPPLGGFAVASDAAAMVAGLQGDDDRRREWIAISASMHRNKPYPTTYGVVLDAIVALHRADADHAVSLLADDPETLDQWQTGAWRHWYAALGAEAAVLSGAPSATGRLEQAAAITAGNPVAAPIVDRAAALAAGAPERLVDIAARFPAESRYQRARTLVLAGGPARAEGQAQMAAMHAAPMDV